MSAWTRRIIVLVVLVGMMPVTAIGARPCAPAWTPDMFGVPGTGRQVNAMAVFDDGGGPVLYLGGLFTVAGTARANGIVRWDGARWSPLGSGLAASGTAAASANAMFVFDDGGGPALYVGGSFISAGGVPANGIAKWDGMQWSALGEGVSGAVNALAVFDNGDGPALYAGGSFVTAGGQTANGIAKWDRGQWRPLGSGMGGTAGESYPVVRALAVFDDGGGPALYAGGEFGTADGVIVNYIAKWDGARWSSLAGGMTPVTSRVLALTVYDDGAGAALYVGGSFTKAGGVEANSIARWNGTQWGPLSSGLSNGSVNALAVFGDGAGPALYAGGSFSMYAGGPRVGIAKWRPSSGSGWAGVGGGVTGSVYALTAFAVSGTTTKPALYAGGEFSMVGEQVADNVARWDGSVWSAVCGGVSNSAPPCPFVSPTGVCPSRGVYAMTSFDDGAGLALYAGGNFRTGGNAVANWVARWRPGRPGEWSPLGWRLRGPVYTFATFDDGTGPALYAGGGFYVVLPLMQVFGVAKWTGTEWTGLGPGLSYGWVNDNVYAMEVFDDGGGRALFMGGAFTRAGRGLSATANGIVKWDGKTAWTSLGSGVNGSVRALAVFDDGSGPALYVGGRFTTAGGITANNIARWNGTEWSALGGGITVSQPISTIVVVSMAVFDGGNGPALYVGGMFDKAGDVPAPGIARWDGTQWSSVGGGIGPPPYFGIMAMTVHDDGGGPALYAGGGFDEAGDIAAANVAKWDGVRWSTLGSGIGRSIVPPYVYAAPMFTFAVLDDGGGPSLYVGGRFDTAGDLSSACVARWGCQTVIADLDYDDDVDLRDFGHFQACFNGPNRAPAWTGCEDADIDGDADVDQADFLRFQACFGGPNRRPKC